MMSHNRHQEVLHSFCAKLPEKDSCQPSRNPRGKGLSRLHILQCIPAIYKGPLLKRLKLPISFVHGCRGEIVEDPKDSDHENKTPNQFKQGYMLRTLLANFSFGMYSLVCLFSFGETFFTRRWQMTTRPWTASSLENPCRVVSTARVGYLDSPYPAPARLPSPR
jgi:hypothetical protein